MKRFLTLLLALLLVCALTAPSVCAAGVSYVGGAEKFVFTPGGDENPTDLFPSFKGIIPGDTLTEEIYIKNNTSKRVNIKVYLRSLGAQEDTDALMSQMNLTVKYKGDSVLFDAPADETAQLTDWVYLGTVKRGGKIKLDVTLEVPKEMGEEFQNMTGYVDWQFKVEEIPITDSAQTGDTSNIFFYAGLLAVSASALVLLLLAKKRRKQED